MISFRLPKLRVERLIFETMLKSDFDENVACIGYGSGWSSNGDRGVMQSNGRGFA